MFKAPWSDTPGAYVECCPAPEEALNHCATLALIANEIDCPVQHRESLIFPIIFAPDEPAGLLQEMGQALY